MQPAPEARDAADDRKCRRHHIEALRRRLVAYVAYLRDVWLFFLDWLLADAAQTLAPQDVLNQAQHHEDARRAEAVMPFDALAQVTNHERREQRADVDAHVEDREA